MLALPPIEPANPDIVYVVEVYDESNNLLYSTKLTTNSGTIDYAPTGKVKVVGYYAYSSGSPTSNKIEKTIGSSAKLDKVNYSITSGGSSVLMVRPQQPVQLQLK